MKLIDTTKLDHNKYELKVIEYGFLKTSYIGDAYSWINGRNAKPVLSPNKSFKLFNMVNQVKLMEKMDNPSKISDAEMLDMMQRYRLEAKFLTGTNEWRITRNSLRGVIDEVRCFDCSIRDALRKYYIDKISHIKE